MGKIYILLLLLGTIACRNQDDVCKDSACADNGLDINEIRLAIIDSTGSYSDLRQITSQTSPIYCNDSVLILNSITGDSLNKAIFPANRQSIDFPLLRLYFDRLDVNFPELRLITPYGPEKSLKFAFNRIQKSCNCVIYEFQEGILVDSDTIYPLEKIGQVFYEVRY